MRLGVMVGDRFLIIVNPIAGGAGLDRLVADVARRLRREQYDVSVERTRAAGDATAIARQAAGDTRAVLAVGGDGTVREVADGLMGRSIPMVVVPAPSCPDGSRILFFSGSNIRIGGRKTISTVPRTWRWRLSARIARHATVARNSTNTHKAG